MVTSSEERERQVAHDKRRIFAVGKREWDQERQLGTELCW